LTSNDPKGVVASIEVPLQSSAAYQASQPGHSEPSARAQAIPASPAAQGWRRVLTATSKTHGLWARMLARTFMVLMVVLAGLLLLGFAALLTGWVPVQMGELQLDGIEGLAVGSVGLLIGFGAAALVVAILVGVLYGLGFVLAAVLVFAVAAMVIGLLPALAPAVLIGLAIWWVVKNRRRP
ncbi:MAG TPA: hypothetical protein PKH72_01030, partial [Rhodoferax sp.]|nr:hypothetical protein [Rhodoferax sp.]